MVSGNLSIYLYNLLTPDPMPVGYLTLALRSTQHPRESL